MAPPLSARLEFRPLTLDALEALIVRDRAALAAATGATFLEPLAAPPEMDHALPTMRETLRDNPASSAWGPFLSCQCRGIASEAATTLIAWVLAQPDMQGVRATIPPWHVASRRVAANAGLQPSGRIETEPDEGPVEVWERERE